MDYPESLTVTSGTPLHLDEGYELVIKSVDIDGNKVYVELLKEGQPIASKVILAANEAEGYFIYSKPGASHEIKVHFKNAFRGADQNLATVDNVQQTSKVDPSRILIDDTQSLVVAQGTPLRLQEGYDLAIESIDIDGNKAYVELSKDGSVVDSRVIVAANEINDAFI
jgi:uncharacterized membrane protein